MNCQRICTEITSWLREQVTRADAKGLVLGLSGGIDSAVTAVLCKKAFPKATLALLLPIYSNPEDAQDAELVAKKYEIPKRTIDLSWSFSVLLSAFASTDGLSSRKPKTVANLKSRLRMATLYFVANEKNYLVAGTGNYSELTLGYFTKYGDGGVDLQPLGSFTKQEVYQLANFLQIPPRLLQKKPSAGLLPGQYDEDELGFSYELIDTFLKGGGAPQAVEKMVLTRMKCNRHKLVPAPIFVP